MGELVGHIPFQLLYKGESTVGSDNKGIYLHNLHFIRIIMSHIFFYKFAITLTIHFMSSVSDNSKQMSRVGSSSVIEPF